MHMEGSAPDDEPLLLLIVMIICLRAWHLNASLLDRSLPAFRTSGLFAIQYPYKAGQSAGGIDRYCQDRNKLLVSLERYF